MSFRASSILVLFGVVSTFLCAEPGILRPKLSPLAEALARTFVYENKTISDANPLLWNEEWTKGFTQSQWEDAFKELANAYPEIRKKIEDGARHREWYKFMVPVMGANVWHHYGIQPTTAKEVFISLEAFLRKQKAPQLVTPPPLWFINQEAERATKETTEKAWEIKKENWTSDDPTRTVYRSELVRAGNRDHYSTTANSIKKRQFDLWKQEELKRIDQAVIKNTIAAMKIVKNKFPNRYWLLNWKGNDSKEKVKADLDFLFKGSLFPENFSIEYEPGKNYGKIVFSTNGPTKHIPIQLKYGFSTKIDSLNTDLIDRKDLGYGVEPAQEAPQSYSPGSKPWWSPKVDYVEELPLTDGDIHAIENLGIYNHKLVELRNLITNTSVRTIPRLQSALRMLAPLHQKMPSANFESTVLGKPPTGFLQHPIQDLVWEGYKKDPFHWEQRARKTLLGTPPPSFEESKTGKGDEIQRKNFIKDSIRKALVIASLSFGIWGAHQNEPYDFAYWGMVKTKEGLIALKDKAHDAAIAAKEAIDKNIVQPTSHWIGENMGDWVLSHSDVADLPHNKPTGSNAPDDPMSVRNKDAEKNSGVDWKIDAAKGIEVPTRFEVPYFSNPEFERSKKVEFGDRHSNYVLNSEKFLTTKNNRLMLLTPDKASLARVVLVDPLGNKIDADRYETRESEYGSYFIKFQDDWGGTPVRPVLGFEVDSSRASLTSAPISNSSLFNYLDQNKLKAIIEKMKEAGLSTATEELEKKFKASGLNTLDQVNHVLKSTALYAPNEDTTRIGKNDPNNQFKKYAPFLDAEGRLVFQCDGACELAYDFWSEYFKDNPEIIVERGRLYYRSPGEPNLTGNMFHAQFYIRIRGVEGKLVIDNTPPERASSNHKRYVAYQEQKRKEEKARSEEAFKKLKEEAQKFVDGESKQETPKIEDHKKEPTPIPEKEKEKTPEKPKDSEQGSDEIIRKQNEDRNRRKNEFAEQMANKILQNLKNNRGDKEETKPEEKPIERPQNPVPQPKEEKSENLPNPTPIEEGKIEGDEDPPLEPLIEEEPKIEEKKQPSVVERKGLPRIPKEKTDYNTAYHRFRSRGQIFLDRDTEEMNAELDEIKRRLYPDPTTGLWRATLANALEEKRKKEEEQRQAQELPKEVEVVIKPVKPLPKEIVEMKKSLSEFVQFVSKEIYPKKRAAQSDRVRLPRHAPFRVLEALTKYVTTAAMDNRELIEELSDWLPANAKNSAESLSVPQILRTAKEHNDKRQANLDKAVDLGKEPKLSLESDPEMKKKTQELFEKLNGYNWEKIRKDYLEIPESCSENLAELGSPKERKKVLQVR